MDGQARGVESRQMTGLAEVERYLHLPGIRFLSFLLLGFCHVEKEFYFNKNKIPKERKHGGLCQIPCDS